MSDRNWQRAVLHDLGAAGHGLADPHPPPAVPAPPAPASASAAWYPEGTVASPEAPTPEPAAPETPAPEAAQPPPMWGAPPPEERQSTAAFRRPQKQARHPPPELGVGQADSGHAAPEHLASGQTTPEQTSPPYAEQGSEEAAEEIPVISFVGDIQADAFGQVSGPEAPLAAPGPQAVDRYGGPQVSAEALVRRNPHGDPLRRRMTRGMRKAVGASAAGDLREMTGVAERLRMPVPSCRRIAVTSIRGGAGKTTVAALLASVVAEHRDDRVLALDADSGLGSLPLRLGVRNERSTSDLAKAHPRSWEETAGFLARTEQGLWVLSSTVDGRVSELELETFQTAAGGLSRYFSTAVIDCGAGIVARLQRGVLAAAHAQVFVTPGTVDGALSARQTLSWFVGSGYEALLSRTVVALVAHSPHTDGDADLDQARQVLSDGGLPVVVVPYDRHLATGTAIDPTRISATVRTAATWIAAEVFARSLSGGAL